MRQFIKRNNFNRSTGSGKPSQGKRARRGAAMVEMAIVLPVLLLLTLGLIEYGWCFLRVSQVNMAARHGVRTAVRPDATPDNVTAAVKTIMNNAGIQDEQYTLTMSPADLNAATGTPVTVHISVEYSQLTLTGSSLIPLPDQIQGRGSMAKERAPSGSGS